jgi:hypothetical protein
MNNPVRGEMKRIDEIKREIRIKQSCIEGWEDVVRKESNYLNRQIRKLKRELAKIEHGGK